jgi:glycosyltransferase involved in cell wall biosynthesis
MLFNEARLNCLICREIQSSVASTLGRKPNDWFNAQIGSKFNSMGPHLPFKLATKADVHATIPAPASHEFDILFSGFFVPRYPGLSGGEIRDFNILKCLLKLGRVGYIPLAPLASDERQDVLSPALWSVPFHAGAASDDGCTSGEMSTGRSGRPMYPVAHRDVEIKRKLALSEADNVRGLLSSGKFDFLFVSPQTNPILELLDRPNSFRSILAAYDVEKVRIKRLARLSRGIKAKLNARLEYHRALRFERSYLKLFHGVVSVSELDRNIYVKDFGVSPDRVLTVDNGVDTEYFAFRDPFISDVPSVMFMGSFSYPPNTAAAYRLLRRIMPLVWKTRSDCQLWIVGQQPEPDLLAASDGNRVFVTGRVPDMRPFLQRSSVVCVPLEVGSGTKYKVLEALAAGAPLVCTPLALEGMDINDTALIVGRNDHELARGILALLDNPTRALRQSLEGRSIVEARYSWHVVLNKLANWLRRIKRLPL